MEIEFKRDVLSTTSEIPAGRYYVGLLKDSNQIVLSGMGQTHVVNAIKKPLKRAIRFADVTLNPTLGTYGLELRYKSPPKTEYLASFKLSDPRSKRLRQKNRI